MQTGKYDEVLPTYGRVIAYGLAVVRPVLRPAVADARTRTWIASAGSTVSLSERKPIVKKTELVYLSSLPGKCPARMVGDLVTLPRLRFFLTVNNQNDSSKIWITNFEMAGSSGRWQALEKRGLIKDKQVQTMWLSDIDAMVTELLNSLSK